MAQLGAGQISLRAIARELDMASSAIHRYFPSRDDVITALLIREYTALGEALQAGQAEIEPGDSAARCKAFLLSGRAWAAANPHSFALLFGTPVPGYVAPDSTKEPASAPMRLLAELLETISDTGGPQGPAAVDVPAAVVAPAMSALPAAPSWRVATALAAWTWMIGAIDAELWGHYVNVVDDPDALYQATVDHWVNALGLG